MKMDKQISEYRSEVIEKSINIEWLINMIISQYYFGKGKKSFIFQFLYDVNCTSSLKRNVLQKIAPEFNGIETLNRLSSIRNLFAHCNQEVFDGDNEIKGEIGKVLDPRNTANELDFKSLYQEFIDKSGGLEIELGKLYESLGGKLVLSE